MIEYVYLAMLTEKSFVGQTTKGINIIGNIEENNGKTVLKVVAGFNSPMELRSGIIGDAVFNEYELDFKDFNREEFLRIIKKQMNKLFKI